MKTRRMPQPKLPDPPSLRTILSVMVVALCVVLYIVSLTYSGTFDAVMISKTPAGRLEALKRQAETALGTTTTASWNTSLALSTVHPILIALVGIPLTVLPDSVFPMLMTIFSVCIVGITGIVIWKLFPQNRMRLPTLAYLLANLTLYEEMKNPGFQLVRIILSGALLLKIENGKNTTSIFFLLLFLMILEPLNCILPFMLVFGQQRKTSFAALGSWIVLTGVLLTTPFGVSYRETMIHTFLSWIPTTYSMTSIGKFLPLPPVFFAALFSLALGGIIILSRRLSYPVSLVVGMILVVLFSSNSIPASFLLPPALTILLLLMGEIQFTPLLAAVLFAIALPSPIFWVRVGTTTGDMLSSQNIALAAIWHAYWGALLIGGIILSKRTNPATITLS